MTPNTAPSIQPDSLPHALALAAIGWRVLPIRPGGKHPPITAWQDAATTDPATITSWFTGLYRGHGLGVACGPLPNGWTLFVLDIDHHGDIDGATTLEALEAKHAKLPPTVTAITGNNGRHIFFTAPPGVTIRNSAGTKLGPGLDIRGDGGQVVVAPTIHPNGNPYTWQRSPSEWAVAKAPGWLLALIGDTPRPERIHPPEPPRPAPAPDNDDSIAAWVNRTHRWDTQLVADGWTPNTPRGNEQAWTRPGKDPRDGTSAVLHLPDGPFVIWSTSVPALQQPWATTQDGSGWAYGMFGYIAATRHHGDRSAAARIARADRTATDRPPTSRQPPNLPPVDTAPIDPHTWEDVAMRGGDALTHYGDAPTARWGTGDRLLWARGESLLIAGRTGVGKTTLTVSILAALIGLETECLGLPIAQAGKVLYLAMDRPRQIIRAMTRRFHPDQYGQLNDRLIIRRGPLPSDLSKIPDLFLTMAQRYDAEVVIVDSLKDAAVKLTDDEVGGQINRAVQYLNQHDIDALVLHHNRKGDATQKQGADYEPTVEDVYGSNWITSGAGSVIILHGAPGAELVKMWHVKQPAEPIGPWTLEHDHNTGRTVVVRGFEILPWLRTRGTDGATALDAARAEHAKDTLKSQGLEAARAKRRLDGLVKTGCVERMGTFGRDSGGQQVATRWRVTADEPVTIHRDGHRDGPLQKMTVTAPPQTVTKNTKPQVTTVGTTVTDRDGTCTVTFPGGINTPGQRHSSEPDEIGNLL